MSADLERDLDAPDDASMPGIRIEWELVSAWAADEPVADVSEPGVAAEPDVLAMDVDDDDDDEAEEADDDDVWPDEDETPPLVLMLLEELLDDEPPLPGDDWCWLLSPMLAMDVRAPWQHKKKPSNIRKVKIQSEKMRVRWHD